MSRQKILNKSNTIVLPGCKSLLFKSTETYSPKLRLGGDVETNT